MNKKALQFYHRTNSQENEALLRAVRCFSELLERPESSLHAIFVPYFIVKFVGEYMDIKIGVVVVWLKWW